jgi:hypothetical protein
MNVYASRNFENVIDLNDDRSRYFDKNSWQVAQHANYGLHIDYKQVKIASETFIFMLF